MPQRDDVLRAYETLLADADSHMAEGWFDAGALPQDGRLSHERNKFRLISGDVLDRFREHRIGGIGIELSDYGIPAGELATFQEFDRLPGQALDTGREMTGRLLQAVSQSLRALRPEEVAGWLQAAGDDIDLGGRKGVISVNGRMRITSEFAVRMADRLARTMRAVSGPQRNIGTVLELGGGFGRCLLDVMSRTGARTGILVDLPLNMLLAWRYCEATAPGVANLVWTEKDKLLPGRVNILAPWLLGKIDRPVDLALNYLSLQHMTRRTQDYYFRHLFQRRVALLYHENRLRPRDDVEGRLEESPLRRQGEVSMSEAFQRPVFSTGGGEPVEIADLRIYRELILFREG